MALVGLCDIPLSARLLIKLCREKQWSPAKVVYLFPSNAGHHLVNVTPCTLKNGLNLAEVAWHFGSSSTDATPYPTLGLPTVDINHVDQPVVKSALCDLGRVLGYGMHVVVSVRLHCGDRDSERFVFSDSLQQVAGYCAGSESEVFPKPSCELNFWGGVQAFHSDFHPVADLYHRAIDFAAQLPDDYFLRSQAIDEAQRVSKDFARGFQQGLDDFKLQNNAEWYGVDHQYQRVARQAASTAQQLGQEARKRSAVLLDERDSLLRIGAAAGDSNCCRCALL